MKNTNNPTPNMHTCARCGVAYDWRRSTSRSLKMTYCNSLCEAADLGFTIEALLQCESLHPHGPQPLQKRLVVAAVSRVSPAAA